MTPANAIALYREARAKRPALPFLPTPPTQSELPSYVGPPSRLHRKKGAHQHGLQRKGTYAHPKMDTHERAVHGQAIQAGKRRARELGAVVPNVAREGPA